MFNFVNNLFNSWIINKVNYWAKTGENTDECYKRGFLPVQFIFTSLFQILKILRDEKFGKR